MLFTLSHLLARAQTVEEGSKDCDGAHHQTVEEGSKDCDGAPPPLGKGFLGGAALKKRLLQGRLLIAIVFTLNLFTLNLLARAQTVEEGSKGCGDAPPPGIGGGSRG